MIEIWDDDIRLAAATLGLAAGTRADEDVDQVAESIYAGFKHGRPITYVLEIIRQLSEGWEGFSTPETAAAFRQLAAKAQAHEDQLRADGQWRKDDD